MNVTARGLATYADLFDLPEHLIGEILHGQLITQPRPAMPVAPRSWARN